MPDLATGDDAFFRGKRVLITGGLGFIGSTLARRLTKLGSVVLVIDNAWPQYGGLLFNLDGFEDQVQVNISDVRDPCSLQHLVRDQDMIFNLAGQASHLDSMEDPYTDLEINCRAQLTILEACRRVNPAAKVIFASTRQIYGRPELLPVDERHRTQPVDVNGINKLAGESYHTLYNDVYGIATCSLRLTNTYGPRMRIKDARQTFLGLWIRQVLASETIEVWGGSQLRDLTYVDDVVDAFLLSAASPHSNGQVFNIGGTGVVTLEELAELLIAIHGSGTYHCRDFPAERKRIDIGDYYADDRLIRSTLGWLPRTDLREGLRRTLEFYSEHVEHYR